MPFQDDINDPMLGVRATRVHITLLACSIIILAFYSSLTLRTRSISVSQPSITTFERLDRAYSLTLTCLCSQVAIPHKKMLITSPARYHQVRPITSKIRLIFYNISNVSLNAKIRSDSHLKVILNVGNYHFSASFE